MAEEVVPAPARTSNPAHPTTLQREVSDSILKYLRDQIDASLKNKTQSENMEDKLDNVRVEAKQLPEKFLDVVKVWDIKAMITMMGMEHQLMRTPCTWGFRNYGKGFPAVCTIFQLAVLLNSNKMVGEMLRIFICEVCFSALQLKDLFEQRFEVYGNEISTWDTARVSGNRCIVTLFKKASEGNPIDFENDVYFARLEGKQDICDLLRPILDEQFEDDVDTNWSLQALCRPHPWWGRQYGISLPRDEDNLFVFHWIAAQPIFSDSDFIEFICKALGSVHTKSLLKLTDHNGQTPLHILVSQRDHFATREEMKLFGRAVMKCGGLTVNEFVDVRDLAGRTCLHYAAANDCPDVVQAVANMDGVANNMDGPWFEKLVNVSSCDFGPFYDFDERRATTALRLAVKHNNDSCVKMLVKHGCDINASSWPHVPLRGPDRTESVWSMGAFQIAALAGHIRILKFFLKQSQQSRLSDERLIDALRYGTSDHNYFQIPALHLAAIGANPLSVKILLDSGKIDPFTSSKEYGTALHFVAGWELEDLDIRCASDFVTVGDYSDHMASKKLKTLDANQKGRSLGGIMGCMDMLLQAGFDMEQEDRHGQTPQLRPSASDELSRWWYDKLTRQNQETKTNLVAAANAVSVTAALVAAAAFVGPLTPPLGFSLSTDAWLTGYSQVNHTAVQAFLFCNSLSFYFAIASIMLAVIPFFTIPQEALPLEVRIANRVVQVAVGLLFLSIACVICAFSAATIAVVPESRWQYKVLAVVSTILGSLVCLIVLCLFLLRLMRLVKPNAVWVRILTFFIFFPSKKQMQNDSDTD